LAGRRDELHGRNHPYLRGVVGMDIIESRQNTLVKHIVKLAAQRRARQQAAQTLLDGVHLIDAALAAGLALERLLVMQSALEKPEVAALLARYLKPPHIVTDQVFAALTDLDSPSGIVAILPIPAAPVPIGHGCVLLLDGVQDPGNVGALLRTAAAAGVAQVWMNEGCADAWSPKVLRAGMGAHFLLPLVERLDLTDALANFAGKVAVTALQDSQPLYASDLTGDLALVMGSEGRGVSAPLLARADLRIRIPMRAGMESLNVAASAAICLYERVRQMGGVP